LRAELTLAVYIHGRDRRPALVLPADTGDKGARHDAKIAGLDGTDANGVGVPTSFIPLTFLLSYPARVVIDFWIYSPLLLGEGGEV
jgi:hypothetical protein